MDKSIAKGDVIETEVLETIPKPQDSNSHFTKPDIYCRFSACLHLLGAISILVGCLLISAFTFFGIMFLSIGFAFIAVGILLGLTAVSMTLRRNQSRKDKKKSIEEYRRAHMKEMNLELVSNYFEPNSQTRNLSLPLETNSGIDKLTPNQSIETLFTEKSVHYLEAYDKFMTKPVLTLEPPSNEITPKRSPLSCPSQGLVNNLTNANIIPFYPTRTQLTLKQTQKSVLTPTSAKAITYSVSPQRHRKLFSDN
jgi:hypothetical protein